jgi:hypothetical protein
VAANRGEPTPSADVVLLAYARGMAGDFIEPHLQRLSDLDLSVRDAELDLRGWTVVSSGGAVLGEVQELIADTDAMSVCYLEFTADAEAAGSSGTHVYVPLRAMDLDRERKRLVLRDTDATLPRLPLQEGDR